MEYSEDNAKEIIGRLGLDPKTKRNWKCIKSIPGKYADKKQAHRKRCDLIILCKNKAGHILKAIN